MEANERRPEEAGRPAAAGEVICQPAEEQRDELAREQAARAEAEAAVARLRAIEYVTEAALANLPLEDLLHELLRRIRQLLGGDAARLLLLTEDGRALAVRAIDGVGAEAPEQALVPMGRGVAGRIAAAGKPMIFDDLSQVEVVSPTLRARIKSQIGAPLVVNGQVIGVVDVGTVEFHHFTGEDLRLLQLVADRAALAIENARLYHQAHFERTRWQTTVESMLDPMVVADAQGRAVYMNAAYRRYVGQAVEAVPTPPGPLPHYRFFRPDGTPFPPEDLPLRRAAQRGEEVRNLEALLRLGEGEERVAVWNAAPLREDDQIVGAVAVGRDVTQERRAEAERSRLLAEVQQRAAEMDATLTSIADGLVIYDRDGAIVRMNAAAEHMLGYPPEALRLPIAERIATLRPQTADGRPLPPEESPPVRALRGETVRGMVLVIHPRAAQEYWVAVSSAPIRAPDGRPLGAVSTLTDITALHRLQEQREDILRTVSHDVRSPLTVVQVQAQLLLRALDKAGLSGPPRQSAEAILTSARRMNTMIQELVDAARLEAGVLRIERRPVDLPTLTLDLQQRLAGTMETGRIHVEAPEGLPPVLADPDRLERILTNLFSNALKYSAPGTPVTVRLSRRDGEVVTVVSDQGPGISPEDLPHVFERYYRGRLAGQPPEGLGLGLYVTRMLVEAHGGRIWAASEPGVGSTFSFSLPVAAEAR